MILNADWYLIRPLQSWMPLSLRKKVQFLFLGVPLGKDGGIGQIVRCIASEEITPSFKVDFEIPLNVQ